VRMMGNEAARVFDEWMAKPDRQMY
jgi:hypothetical protein